METFENIDGKFYEAADKRKDKLVQKMMLDSRKRDIYFRIFKKEKHIDSLEIFLEEIEDRLGALVTGKEMSEIEIDVDSRYLNYKDKRGDVYRQEFIAFRLFDPFLFEKDGIVRYTYFEIYFDDYIMGVIIKKSTYSSNQGFSAFDLDQREWAQVKMQMRVWKQLYHVELEEIGNLSSRSKQLLKFFEKNIREIKKDNSKDLVEKLFSIKQFWIFISYLTMVQMIPMLEKSERPFFTMNLYADENIGAEFLEKMRLYLATFNFSTKKCDEGHIIYTKKFTDLENQYSISNCCLLHNTSEKSVEYAMKILNELASESNQPDDYPLRRTPIIVGGNWIDNSAVFNLEIQTKEFVSEEIRDEELLGRILEMFLNNLKTQLQVKPALHEDDSDILKAYRAQLSEVIKNEKKDWEEWSREERIQLLPAEYLKLAIWMSVLLGCKGKRRRYLEDSLLEIEENCKKNWASISDFLKELIESDFPEKQPKSVEEASEEPFIKDHEGKRVIVLTNDWLGKKSKELNLGTASEVKRLLKQKGLLLTNSGEKALDKNFTFGNASLRACAIIVEKLKKETF